ncbi:hypothetical protein ACJIZ3_020170 [Penstemon smallii]|uniref:MATH domain-containing protein n=1 Tax=Penstemon smallii TaxID=265156 RepID=A0ABD3SI86_9LAMI
MALIPHNLDDEDEVAVETRNVSPSHFLFKIESFSLLSKSGIVNYESTEFSAGDYKWKLIFYPNGEDQESKNEDDDNIAVNLAVADTSSLPPRWEVNAVFSIFLYNQKSDNFLSMRGRTRRFHAVKLEWGFPKFISKKSLIDPSNGYLVNDDCVFGAEVFVIKSQGVVECLSMYEVGKAIHRSWRISQFSQLEVKWVSEEFLVGDHTKMEVYPRGNGAEEDRSISIFLSLVDSSLTPFHKVKANYTVKIKHQYNGEDCIESDTDWFTSLGASLGFPEFMSISDMNDPGNGYLFEDCCILEVEMFVQAVSHVRVNGKLILKDHPLKWKEKKKYYEKS